MASAPALLLPGVRVAVARPAPAGAGGSVAPHLRFRPAARAHAVAAATRTPPRSVSVRCARKTGSSFAGGPSAAPVAGHGAALDALNSAAADAFRPLLDNFNHIRSLKHVADANDYNIGMPFGLVTASIGCYQLFKTAPSMLLDVVLGYMFYKLSVVSSQVHRQGFANDLITRIKVAIAVIMLVKSFPSNPSWLGFIRTHVIFLYLSTFLYDIFGWKQYARYDLSKCVEVLQGAPRSFKC